MAESLTGRVGRLVAGSFNALIDAVEGLSPEVVMEQALRELNEAIDDVRAELGREVAYKHLVSKRIAEENRRHEELSAQLEVALSENRDELAEAAIARQLDIEAQIPVLEQSLAERAAKEKELEGYVTALQAKKREMQDELQSFSAARKEAGSGAANGAQSAAGTKGSGVASRVANAESAFERVLRKHTGLNSSAVGTDPKDAAKLAELENLARQNRIKERLAQAKANQER